MKERFAWLIATLITLLLAATPSIAHASSEYDASYTTVDSLFYGDVDYYGINCPMQDVSETFTEIFGNPDYWVYDGEYEALWPSFEDARRSGSWAASVQLHRMDTGYDANINLVWNPGGGQLEFTSNAVIVAGASGTRRAQLYTRQDLLGSGGCVPAIRGFSDTGAGIIAASPGVNIATTTNGFYHSNYIAAGWIVDYPDGYAGTLIRDGAPAANYVALGDSFSSGEGVEPYFADSHTDMNACDRSHAAYSQLLLDNIPELTSPKFVACSGAVTFDLYNRNHTPNLRLRPDGSYVSEPPQLDALDASTKLVTLTIGGNDLGFAQIMAKCVVTADVPTSPKCKNSDVAKAMKPRLAALSSSSNRASSEKGASGTPIYGWQKIIRDIHTKAPNAQIAVAGYPQLISPKGWLWSRGRCTVGWDTVNGSGAPGPDPGIEAVWLIIFKDDASWIAAQTKAVNDAIRAAVIDSGVPQARYVSVESQFSKHALCDTDPWIHPISTSGGFSHDLTFAWPGSLHPTTDGQSKGYAPAFRAALPTNF